jgi:predicted ATPase
VLGLLAVSGARERPTLVGFEEPENGVHPRRIRLIAEFLRALAAQDSQLIVTTHSPLLADLIPEDSLYACRKDGGRTLIQPLASGALFKSSEIESALDAEESQLTAGQRMLRGDFDA